MTAVLRGDEQDKVFTPWGNDCFYCGDKAWPPFVMWQGVPDTIYLHPECAIRLMIRLMRDVHDVQCNSHVLKRGQREKAED